MDGPVSDYRFGTRTHVKTDIKPFSRGDLYELPHLVESAGCQLYVNPQLSWSPFHVVPTINVVHDLWPVTNPNWLPSTSDLMARFAIDDLAYFEALDQWFDQRRATASLTPFGMEMWVKARTLDNMLLNACWAQFAATVTLSARIVTVSQSVRENLQTYFLRGGEAVVIYNTPNRFPITGDRCRKHILVLSKLEERKNLDAFLRAYESYALQMSTRALPLIIAGDPGYASVASRILSHLADMRQRGSEVRFFASVTDKELADLFRNSAMLVFPTHFEGFGLPPLEAMLAEVPVLATATGMMATELGRHADLFDPGNQDELVNKLCMLTERQKSKNELLSAKRAVEEFIQKEDSVAKWANLIRDLLRLHFERGHRDLGVEQK